MRSEYTTGSVDETRALGRDLARSFGPGRVYALEGELGAGKTVLAKGIAEGLGAGHPDTVTSPTFTLIHRYADAGGRPVYHADLYRLAGPDDAAAAGLEEIIASGATVIIEWAERLRPQPGQAAVRVSLAHAGGDRRVIRVTEDCPPAA